MGNGQEPPNLKDLKPRITVIGVGGAGCNAVNNMIAAGLQGVEFVVANTDAQSLVASSAEHRIQLGAHLTEGLGAGSKPEIGHAAAEETLSEIEGYLYGSHMVFIAAGMGGGTGTGAAGVIARVARELGALTVAIVTKPFQFEGSRRMRLADAGINELKKYVDTLIVIPNQNLFRIANERTTFAEAFVLADQVLYSGVACIVDLVLKEGLINLDFADVRTVMTDMGSAMMGTGEASGDRRAIVAAEEAIANPLLDDVSLKGARGLLLSITGGRDLTLYEVDEAANRVRQEIDPEANVILGATFDDNLGDRVRVSIVASGMTRAAEGIRHAPAPVPAHQAPLTQTAQPFTATAQPVQSRAWDDDQMNKRLSDAIKTGAVPPPPPRTLQQRPFGEPAASAKTEWRAPGNVLIEESFGAGTQSSRVEDFYRAAAKGNQTPEFSLPPAGQPNSQHPAQYSGQHAGGFEPARPQDIRRTQPVMPAIEDFPPTAQREWRSKSGTAAAGPGSRKGSVAPADPPKRPSLFERLSKMGRREDQNPDTSDDPATSSPELRSPAQRHRR